MRYLAHGACYNRTFLLRSSFRVPTATSFIRPYTSRVSLPSIHPTTYHTTAAAVVNKTSIGFGRKSLSTPSKLFSTSSSSSIINNNIHCSNSNKSSYLKALSASILLASSLYYVSQKTNIAHAESSLDHSSASPPLSRKEALSSILSDLQNDQNRIAVHTKSTEELAMALFVYQLCALPWLVDAAPHMITAAQKFGLEAPIYWFVQHTFFRHFCGGQTPEECISSMDKLALSGINCILDLSVEADLHLESSQAQDPSKEGGKYYRDDQHADVILKMLKTCVATAAQGGKPTTRSMVALKVTALSPPELLLRLNQVLSSLDQGFVSRQKNGYIDADGIQQVAETVLPEAETEEQQKQRDMIFDQLRQKGILLDVIEYRKLFDLQGTGRDIWWRTRQTDAAKVSLTMEDLEALDRMESRLDEICGMAHEANVGVMIDAEQSYFQEAIDYVAINLQRKYNQEQNKRPTVYNTYQMYTKAAGGKLKLDVERSERENFRFAAKLVRGAYMVSERQRAKDMNYPSPIHDTIEDTHASYNSGVRYLLGKIKQHQEQKLLTAKDSNEECQPLTASNSPIVFMVASHNRDSVILTIDEMEKNNISPHSNVVQFGQLYGMQDQLSYTLGHHGFAVYKYLPYGMIDEVIPYLLRRAQENASVLGAVNVERALIWKELKGRMTGDVAEPAVVVSTSPAATDISITDTA
ncbi:FAD-linked oxidoreductase-like protein [Mycotypha africana]|uniref:FAD-linked oxidoreductase-like protein n=1 Tax=Mycotypha africana TaxID=64632 RepID=UPI0023015A88|nr:FAD-linked oxidoreductase-like protein [Mycotypha africana]KAI8987873.1 FAD-linked oxidoreductase-like protein [Mycotypha africana]